MPHKKQSCFALCKSHFGGAYSFAKGYRLIEYIHTHTHTHTF
jgi:hypothetical protein